MPDAAARQSTATPEATAQQQNGEARGRPGERVSDLAIAGATAQAVRNVPGVADLSAGLVVPAATYGSGQRVNGVVVHHLTPDTIGLEIHVIASEAFCGMAAADATVEPQSVARDAEPPGLLAEIAARIREVVYRTVQDMTALAIARVDVLIDDLR